MSIEKTLNVSGMHCASCASVIKRTLTKLPGVESCEVSFATEKAKVKYDPDRVSMDEMNSQIDKLGYSLLSNEHSHASDQHSMHEGHDMMTPVSSDASVKASKLKELGVLKSQVLLMIPMIFASIFVMVWEIGANTFSLWAEMPEVVMEFFHHLLPLLATYALFVIGTPYLKGVWRFTKYRVANMDTLVGIGTLVAFLYSFVVTAFEEVLAPYLNTTENYYDVTIVVIGFITLGKFLETRSKLRTGEAIEKLLGLQAKKALLLRAGVEVEVAVEEVMVGDIMVVKPGEKIALDGVVVEGKSSVDESMITGEPMPVDKNMKDSVIGGTINKQGYLHIEVTKVGEATMLAQIIRMVEEAQSSKAPIEALADRVSAVFVPVVLVFAVATFFGWLFLGSSFTIAILSFVGILVIACPCAMGLATPTAIIVGVGKAAGNGILIKNAESLEKFEKVNFVVMDKTGTITKGTPEVTDIVTASKFSQKEILRVLFALESRSEHPLAEALVKAAKEKGLSQQKVKDFEVLEGKGVRGIVAGEVYFVGNLRLANELKLKVDEKVVDGFVSTGKTPVVLMTKKEIVGYVGIADTVKEEARNVVNSLHKQGIKVAMLTGDNAIAAQYIATQVGIDKVIAEVLPGDKANEVRKLKSEGYRVAMVGDGINDAPALATADVGVAMGTGTDVAIESAGITLLGGNIAKLPHAINLARATMRIVRQNLFWAFFYNVISLPVAAGALYPFFGILLSPAIAGAAMGLSSVSVVANSLRLKSVRV